MPAAIFSSITDEVNVRVSFQWDGSTWYDETGNLLDISGALETTSPNEAFQSGKQIIQQMTIRLANPDLRYSPYNTSGALYTHIQNGKAMFRRCKVEFKIGNPGTWETIFVGVIKLPRERIRSNEVTFTVWDIGEKLRQPLNTTVQTDKLEHELVIYYLGLAGLVDGVDFISPAYAVANSVTATIAYSTISIPYSWLDDETIWDELVDIAQASGSRIYVNKDGMIYYEKAWRWAIPYTPYETITFYNDVEPTYDDKAFYDEVAVGYSARLPGTPNSELWRMSPNRLIGAGKTEVIEARLRQPALAIDAPVLNKTYYVRSLNGTDMSAQCSVTLQTYAQLVKITVVNSSSVAVVLGNFTLYGQPLSGQPNEQVKRAIASPINNRRVEVRNNPYLQSILQAESVADTLKWWYESFKMQWEVKGLPGLPSRRLGQRVQLQTPQYSGDMIIVKIKQNISVRRHNVIDYTQDLSLIQDVFGSNYFIVGQSTLGSNHLLWV